jgi:hypothetical protein
VVEKISLKTLAEMPQVHLPFVNSGADPIDRWLHQQPLF